ncbi:AAA domain containing protein [uncultured Caudovirales phage]|uniref:AAA domain containing protein n=1 Tax=uncultured Caudovirales phage TaxID=2100421 RepID=A0A6J5N1K1_9CAUD|nr:AAA domain containing protein [uncultured Caudovirales phage]
MSDVCFLTAPGSFFTLIDKPDQIYPGISWNEIVKLVSVPQSKEKRDADFFIPSTYRAHDGRAHEAQRERGAFRALAIDIDRGNPSLGDVQDAVQAVCGDVGILIYSSSGASPENRKWRAIVPLAAIYSGAEYEEIQTAFFELLHGNGIHPDGALARCGQPIYLPNVPLDRRNPDLTPKFYESRIIRGKPMMLDASSPIIQEMYRKQEQRRLALEQADRTRLERDIQRAERKIKFPDDVSPVDVFNTEHSIEDLLARYQYERQGSSQHYRSRHQTSPSYATENFGTHWVSLSGSDAAAGLGRWKTVGEHSYCWGDAFDLFVHYEHGGDLEKAVRTYGAEIKPTRNEIPDNGMDDFDYVAPSSPPEAPVSASDDLGDIDIPDGSFDAPEAAPDWPTVYDMFDEASITPRAWIYGNHYLRSFVSVLASAGGVGKTSLQIVEALAIVTGKPLLGEVVKEQTNVWIVNLEDPMEEIQRRVLAAMRYYEIKPEEVRGKLFVNAGRDFSLKFGIQTREGVLPNTKLVEYLCKKIPEKQIGCVFIDPFVGAHSINENDNMAVNAIVGEIRRVADETNCAIGLVHHIRKGNGDDASIDSVRGAGSLIGAARAARVVNRMSADDAARLGIDEAEARSIFRVDDGKANLAPPADAAVYRKMIGVKIDNGEWIGVCVDFKLPDVFDGMSGKDAKAAQRIVADAHSDGEPLRESSQSPKWVGVPIADMLGIDITEKRGRVKVSSIIKTWIKTNVLATEKMFDHNKGREFPVIVVGEWINGDEI